MNLAVNTVNVMNLETGRPEGPPLTHMAMLMDDGRIFYGFGTTSKPTPTLVRAGAEPANAVAIAIVPMALFVVDKRGDLFRRDALPGAPTSWQKDPVAKDVVGLDADQWGTVWVVNKKGEVFTMRSGLGGTPGWTPVSGLSTASFWS